MGQTRQVIREEERLTKSALPPQDANNACDLDYAEL